jgi:hypothetical protein
MADDLLLPIKVVFRDDTDYHPRGPMRMLRKPLQPVTAELRRRLASEVANVKEHFSRSFQRWPGVPGIARVQLIPQAVAKSHRPQYLFNRDTCPIVGGAALGELFVRVQPAGLDELSRRILTSNAKDAEPSISVLERIVPYTEEDALSGRTMTQLANAMRDGETGKPLKVRLFHYGNSTLNVAVRNAFLSLTRDAGLVDVEEQAYASRMTVFRIRNVPTNALRSICSFIGTQSCGVFPRYRLVRTAARALGSVSAINFPPPERGGDYGLVGIIDTGTDVGNRHLQAWVAERDTRYVPASLQDNEHGSFVAGLAIHSHILNHRDALFPRCFSRIVDVVALDRSGEIAEDDLRQIIEESCKNHPHVKVWNLSLGTDDTPCIDGAVSEFAAFLDEISQRFGVLFVIAAGNYSKHPPRPWPPTIQIGDADRICPPADAVRAITVGSVAHRATASSLVQPGNPSSFTRRGPGGAYLIKPELMHFGGNCDSAGDCIQSGIVSVDGSGQIAESIGTSFATPIISTLAANVWRELGGTNYSPTPAMVKGLLMHAAHVRNGAPDSQTFKYAGVGIPPDVDEVVNCTQSSATMIFSIDVNTTPRFLRRPFPMPRCLEDSDAGLRAEIFMTLIYDPPLDRRFGVEYCRRNVTASLGTVESGADSDDENHNRQIPPVPRDITEGWEKDLVTHGFKWSPVKLYHRRFFRGPVKKTWQLKLDVLYRSGVADGPDQNVALFITIRDPEGTAKVYNEMVQEMTRLNWITQNLSTRAQQRERH